MGVGARRWRKKQQSVEEKKSVRRKGKEKERREETVRQVAITALAQKGNKKPDDIQAETRPG